jgi:hypothetical protein
MEVYDILDSSIMESIGFREFCVLVYLVSASNSSQLMRCLYDHGALIFDILAAGQPLITGERLKTLGIRVLSINDEIIEDVSMQHGIKYSSMVGFEEFQVFYFEVFQLVDAATIQTS